MQKTWISINDISIVDVTPAQAKVWLEECNTKNRRMNLGHVKRIVTLIQKGQWLFNGDTICFDKNNVLVDGQHRLAAIAQSGVTVKCIIIRNLDPQVIMTKDMEMKPRNLSDLLSMDGIKDATNCAAIVSRMVALQNNQCIVCGGNATSRAEDKRTTDSTVWDKYELYYKYQNLFDNYVLVSHRLYNKRRAFFSKAEIGSMFAYLVIDKNHNEEKVNDFFNQLYYGNETCPAITSLRDKLNKDSDKGNVMMGSYKQSLFIKTWNYFIKGAKNKNVNYDPKKEGRVWFV